MLSYIKNRMKEPSSHAGIAAIMQGVKLFFPEYTPVLDAGTVIFGMVASMIPDKKGE